MVTVIRSLLALALLLGLAACPPPADDDDASADDDDATLDDDDATADDDDVVDDDDSAVDDDDATACSVELSGSVIAVDRQSGAVLSQVQYDERVGGLILYVLPDASDLSVIHDKVTMTGPGEWSLTLDSCPATLEIGAVVDADDDHIIMTPDVAREHAFNPIFIPGDGVPIEGLDVVIDLARLGGAGDDDDASGDDDDDGGPGDDDDDDSVGPSCPSSFSGEVVVTGYPDEAVAVTANAADLTFGPEAYVILDEPGTFDLSVPCFADMTSFLGILDADANTYFEPSDPQGISEANPWILGLGPSSGVTIEIPATEEIDPPAPAPYIGVTGSVAYESFTTGDILVSATVAHPGGTLFSQQTLAAPGAFSLIVPPGSANVLIWAVLDEDGDGDYDVAIDPYDSHGPLNVGNGVSGIELVLEEAPPLPGSLAGVMTFSGGATGADCQRTAIFDYEPAGPLAVPLDRQTTPGPSSPVPFLFEGLTPGPYWIAGYLDLGCNNDVGGAGPEDPDGRTDFPVLVGDGQDVTGVVVDQTL